MKALVPVLALSLELGTRLALFERGYGSEIAVQVVDGVCDCGPTITAHAAEAFYIGDNSEEDIRYGISGGPPGQADQALPDGTHGAAVRPSGQDGRLGDQAAGGLGGAERGGVHGAGDAPAVRAGASRDLRGDEGALGAQLHADRKRESLRIDRVQLGKDIQKWKTKDLKAVKLEAEERAAAIQARVALRGAVVGLPSKVQEEQILEAPPG
ncbi:unnamed protein product [Prorocentrum cordatum]|uniref:Uncharacterized protein n=1 Tax=Prorocentrum cordatum TaxID=2364126 RepID=A0ABN9SNH9_9DINO|nr:unnamed protein product [Polarella glacialis]